MDRATRILEQLRVTPGTRAALDDRDPAWRGGPDYEDLFDSIHSLDLRWPEVSARQQAANAAARRQLEEEPSLTMSG